MPSRNNDYYFYLGGALSFAFFLLFATLFSVFIMQQSRIKKIQLSSLEYISVNLDTVPTAKPVKAKKPQQKKEPEKSEVKPLLETKEVPKVVNTDLASLFGEVKTKKLVKRNKSKKTAVDDKFLKKIKKRIETKDTKVVRSTEASSLVKNLKLSKQD